MRKLITFVLLSIISFSCSAENANLLSIEIVSPETVAPVEFKRNFKTDFTIVKIPKEELIDPQELSCLQANIFYEARNQGLKGMQAVANVTINRTQDQRWPPSICGVVQEQKVRGVCQFSWFCDKKLRRDHVARITTEIEAWNKAGEVARKALIGELQDIVRGATNYHATYVSPSWARRLFKIKRIGTHIFYK